MTATPAAPRAEPATAAPPDDVVRATRALAAGGVLAMIVLGLAWELWLAPTGARTWALKVLPLAVPVAGLLKLRLYTYRWTSLLVWLYFTEGVVRATTERGASALLATAQLLLALLVFAACAWHVRWRLARATRAKEPA